MQNARENPLAAAAAAAAVSGAPPPQNNAENLLDIDFDGSVPASAQKEPSGSLSGLEGLAGTPQRVQSPAAGNGPSQPPPPPTSAGGIDDLMGLSNGNSSGAGDLMGGGGGGGFQINGGGSSVGEMSSADILGGFAALDMNATSQPPPSGQQVGGQKKTNEDLLGLF